MSPKYHSLLKCLALLGLFVFPPPAIAHVGYLLSEEEMAQKRGLDLPFLLEPFSQPLNIGLMLGTLAIIFVLYRMLKPGLFFPKKTIAHPEKLQSYTDQIPLVLRLTLGIALIRAGMAQALISPTLPTLPQFSVLQVLLGLCLLFGFLLPTTLLFAIICFGFALSQNLYLIGNAEFLAGSLVLLIVANPTPGLDDRLDIHYDFAPVGLEKFVPFILRIGTGGALIFLAVYEKLLNPHLSAAVVEKYRLSSVIPVSTQMWVLSAGLIELAVGLALMMGLHTRLITAMAAGVLTLSSLYFRGEVHAHVTLFGVLLALFVTGGGKLSLDNYLYKVKTQSRGTNRDEVDSRMSLRPAPAMVRPQFARHGGPAGFSAFCRRLLHPMLLMGTGIGSSPVEVITSARGRPSPSGHTGAPYGQPEQDRFASQRRTDAVFRLLRGEGLRALSRELGVAGVTLAQWRDQFLAARWAALR